MTREEREQALEWFKNRPITMSGAKKMYDLAISALEQPEPCEDTVSRKAVEEMLKNGFPARGMWEIEGDVVKQTVCETLADALMELESLPSAQPERTCVNCGRTANNGGWYADGRTRCPIEEHYALPKDGYCHLWEKRNVADDDYPERRTDD